MVLWSEWRQIRATKEENCEISFGSVFKPKLTAGLGHRGY